MTRYYQTNSLYQFITENSLTNFKFTSGNMWQLVYGDSQCNPKLLAIVSGINSTELENGLYSDSENEAINLMSDISERSGIPLRFIRFSTITSEVSEVLTFRKGDEYYQKLSLNELKECFRNEGLPVSNSSTNKYLNDATSSAYHNWQRNELGRDLKVSDFDLWKVDSEGKPVELYELKRSIISLNRWQPYTDDYNNFRLIYNVLSDLEINFKIAYNVRTKNPWNDDISSLKIFDVNFRNDNPIQYNSTLELQEFIK